MPDDTNQFEFERPHYYSTAFAIGIVGAAVMTLVLWVTRLAGLTQLDLAMTLGTVTTISLGANPGAWVLGFIAVLVCGGVFALVYAWVFEAWPAHTARAWLGALIGVVHSVPGGALLGWLMPPLHPATKGDPLLADPGFMGANYGTATIFIFILLHVLYGAIIGGWMHFAPFVQRYLAAVAERHHHGAHPRPPTTAHPA